GGRAFDKAPGAWVGFASAVERNALIAAAPGAEPQVGKSGGKEVGPGDERRYAPAARAGPSGSPQTMPSLFRPRLGRLRAGPQKASSQSTSRPSQLSASDSSWSPSDPRCNGRCSTCSPSPCTAGKV